MAARRPRRAGSLAQARRGSAHGAQGQRAHPDVKGLGRRACKTCASYDPKKRRSRRRRGECVFLAPSLPGRRSSTVRHACVTLTSRRRRRRRVGGRAATPMVPSGFASRALLPAAASCQHAPRRAACRLAPRLPQRAGLPPARPRRRHAVAARPAASSTEQDEIAWERRVAGPRLQDGLDVHRRVHALACRHAAYLFQWRAFCERQGRSWQDTLSDDDEAILACAHALGAPAVASV